MNNYINRGVCNITPLFNKRGVDMSRKVKCPYCEEYLHKEEAHPYKKKYYHPQCFQEWEQQKQHRKELIEYICQIHKLEAPTGMMLKQIKEFQEEYGYKLKGMELALRYFYETLGNTVREGDGIGIIPYVYEEAKKHYIMKKRIEESVKEYMDLDKQAKVVEITSPKFTYTKKSKMIDISSL
jgi:hypothetical protein